MRYGVLIVACGYELYGNCALNLCLSIKAYDKRTPVCLVTDGKAISHLTDSEKGKFDSIIDAKEEDYFVEGKAQYQRLKVCLDQYTPFSEGTMYIDADSIFFPDRKVCWLIGEGMQYDFFMGCNGSYDPKLKTNSAKNYTYWGDPGKICAHYSIKTPLSQLVSGLFWFRNTDFSKKLFQRAREIYDEKGAPCMKWAGGKPDEFCFAVALAEENAAMPYNHPLYFDKINGTLAEEKLYDDFWGMATGGTKLSSRLTILYNRLVKKYAIRTGLKNARFHVDKAKVVKERV